MLGIGLREYSAYTAVEGFVQYQCFLTESVAAKHRYYFVCVYIFYGASHLLGRPLADHINCKLLAFHLACIILCNTRAHDLLLILCARGFSIDY